MNGNHRIQHDKGVMRNDRPDQRSNVKQAQMVDDGGSDSSACIRDLGHGLHCMGGGVESISDTLLQALSIVRTRNESSSSSTPSSRTNVSVTLRPSAVNSPPPTDDAANDVVHTVSEREQRRPSSPRGCSARSTQHQRQQYMNLDLSRPPRVPIASVGKSSSSHDDDFDRSEQMDQATAAVTTNATTSTTYNMKIEGNANENDCNGMMMMMGEIDDELKKVLNDTMLLLREKSRSTAHAYHRAHQIARKDQVRKKERALLGREYSASYTCNFFMSICTSQPQYYTSCVMLPLHVPCWFRPRGAAPPNVLCFD